MTNSRLSCFPFGWFSGTTRLKPKKINIMDFNELKQELLHRAKEKEACQSGYKAGLDANSKSELLKAITNYWCWVFVSAKIIDAEFLDVNFTKEELSDAGIFTSGIHEVSNTNVYACGSSTVEAFGDSNV